MCFSRSLGDLSRSLGDSSGRPLQGAIPSMTLSCPPGCSGGSFSSPTPDDFPQVNPAKRLTTLRKEAERGLQLVADACFFDLGEESTSCLLKLLVFYVFGYMCQTQAWRINLLYGKDGCGPGGLADDSVMEHLC